MNENDYDAKYLDVLDILYGRVNGRLGVNRNDVDYIVE